MKQVGVSQFAAAILALGAGITDNNMDTVLAQNNTNMTNDDGANTGVDSYDETTSCPALAGTSGSQFCPATGYGDDVSVADGNSPIIQSSFCVAEGEGCDNEGIAAWYRRAPNEWDDQDGLGSDGMTWQLVFGGGSIGIYDCENMCCMDDGNPWVESCSGMDWNWNCDTSSELCAAENNGACIMQRTPDCNEEDGESCETPVTECPENADCTYWCCEDCDCTAFMTGDWDFATGEGTGFQAHFEAMASPPWMSGTMCDWNENNNNMGGGVSPQNGNYAETIFPEGADFVEIYIQYEGAFMVPETMEAQFDAFSYWEAAATLTQSMPPSFHEAMCATVLEYESEANCGDIFVSMVKRECSEDEEESGECEDEELLMAAFGWDNGDMEGDSDGPPSDTDMDNEMEGSDGPSDTDEDERRSLKTTNMKRNMSKRASNSKLSKSQKKMKTLTMKKFLEELKVKKEHRKLDSHVEETNDGGEGEGEDVEMVEYVLYFDYAIRLEVDNFERFSEIIEADDFSDKFEGHFSEKDENYVPESAMLIGFYAQTLNSNGEPIENEAVDNFAKAMEEAIEEAEEEREKEDEEEEASAAHFSVTASIGFATMLSALFFYF